MNRTPFPYRDFTRVKTVVRNALCELEETYVLVTGETGTGKTALMSELRLCEISDSIVRTCNFCASICGRVLSIDSVPFID